MEKTNYSKAYRIIHFAIAVSFFLLLVTIFLKATWLNKQNVAAIIQNYLGVTDQVLSQEQLFDLAKQIRQPMLNWHVYIGYGMLGLFGIRFILPFFGEMKLQSPLDKSLAPKMKFQKFLYIVFYVFTIITLITGVLIELGPAEHQQLIKDAHALSIYYLVPFIVIHIAGVIMGELTDQKGIISRIVNGTEEKE